MSNTPTTKKAQFGPTQKDIARALGISQAAVAYALNSEGKPHRIPAETVERVHAKAQELGYRSQRFARILRKGRSHTIGAVFMMSGYHAPQERVMHLVKGAIRAGYQLIAVDLSWFTDDGLAIDTKAVQNYLIDQAVEGVIFCNIMRDPEGSWEAFLKERSLPAVALSSTVGGAIDQVTANVEAAYADMAAHHLAQGSRQLELLLTISTRSRKLGVSLRPLQQRADGFARAIREAGGTLRYSPDAERLLGLPAASRTRKRGTGPEGVVRLICNENNEADSFDFGFEDTAARIRAGEPLGDSILCSNDQMACGVFSACFRHGIDVPGRVRISGMDDAPYARYCGTPLTSIAQPSQETTQWAVERVVELIENPAERGHPREREFPCRLVVRQSTQPNPLLTS